MKAEYFVPLLTEPRDAILIVTLGSRVRVVTATGHRAPRISCRAAGIHAMAEMDGLLAPVPREVARALIKRTIRATMDKVHDRVAALVSAANVRYGEEQTAGDEVSIASTRGTYCGVREVQASVRELFRDA